MVGVGFKEVQRVFSIVESYFLDFFFVQKCFCRCCGFIKDEVCSLEFKIFGEFLYIDLFKYRVM